MTVTVETMTEEHWPAVRAIYEQGIETGLATFETTPPALWADWQRGKIEDCCIVATDGGHMLGWATLQLVSPRACYGGVAEISIYVAADNRGQGVGSLLMRVLIARSEERGIWTLQASVFPENTASLRLAQHHGFRVVGRRERLGRSAVGPLKGQWRDVLLLERRSTVVGVD